MAIRKMNDNEYSFIVADLMVTLDSLKEYILHIRVGEYDFNFDETYDLVFMQEGIRASKDGRINYLLYELMELIQVIT